MYKTFNINDKIRFKMKDHQAIADSVNSDMEGVFKNFGDMLGKPMTAHLLGGIPKVTAQTYKDMEDSEGYITMQMHEFMRTIGPAMTGEFMCPIETTILIKETDLK